MKKEKSWRFEKQGSQAAVHGTGVGFADLLQTCALVPSLAFPNHGYTQEASEKPSQDNCPQAEA